MIMRRIERIAQRISKPISLQLGHDPTRFTYGNVSLSQRVAIAECRECRGMMTAYEDGRVEGSMTRRCKGKYYVDTTV